MKYNKSEIYLDLSKCSESEIKKIHFILRNKDENIHTATARDLINGMATHCYWFLFFDGNAWNQNEIPLSGRTELTYPEFIKLFEGGEEEKLYRPMTEFPPITEGEHHSKMVLVFDEDLDDFDFGFYDVELQKWVVIGGFQMNLICWRHIEKPMYEDVQEYQTILTD